MNSSIGLVLGARPVREAAEFLEQEKSRDLIGCVSMDQRLRKNPSDHADLRTNPREKPKRSMVENLVICP